jgi:hypothetical protein
MTNIIFFVTIALVSNSSPFREWLWTDAGEKRLLDTRGKTRITHHQPVRVGAGRLHGYVTRHTIQLRKSYDRVYSETFPARYYWSYCRLVGCAPCTCSPVLIFLSSIFSFLPPSTTLRRYQRASLATTGAELGTLYCSIVSFAAHTSHGAHCGHIEDTAQRRRHTQEIVRSLIAVRAKLKRNLVLKTNVVYEVCWLVCVRESGGGG